MAFTLQEALGKIGTPGFEGIDGLTRLVSETASVASNAAPNATTLLYSGDIGNAKAWQTAIAASNGTLDANGYKQVVTLDDADVSKLLNDPIFRQELSMAAENEGIV
jgi:hypothetical protein